MPATLLVLLAVFALAGCDTRDALFSVLLVRPAFTGDAVLPPDPPAETVRLIKSVEEEQAVRQTLGLGGPFTGVDYRSEIVAVIGRPLSREEGEVVIDRVVLRGQHTVEVRSRVEGSQGAAASRYGVAAVAVDRFSDDFTDVRGDFQ